MRLAQARSKGRAKFEMAGSMWLDPVGVEQATSEAVARHKAGRFPPGSVVVDLCSGVGGDALAIAERAGGVIAVDRDPGMARRLSWNARVHLVGKKLLPVVGSAEGFPIPGSALVHIDPDRRARPGRQRALHLEDYVPGPDELAAFTGKISGGAIKLGPASDFDAFARRISGAEVEVISLHGECKEATLWFGSLASADRRATMLPGQHTWTGPRNVVQPNQDQSEVLRWVVEPNSALVRAGLLDHFAACHDLSFLDPMINWLTTSTPVESPFLAAFEVEEVLPLDKKRIRRAWHRMATRWGRSRREGWGPSGARKSSASGWRVAASGSGCCYYTAARRPAAPFWPDESGRLRGTKADNETAALPPGVAVCHTATGRSTWTGVLPAWRHDAQRLCIEELLMRTRLLTLGIQAGLMVAALALPAAAETTLRWKFQKGQSLSYVMTQKTETSAQVQGQDIGSTQDVVIDLDWEVGEVSAEGVAAVTQTMKRIRFKLESPVGAFDYDSQEDKPIEGQMAVLGPMLKGMVNQPVEMQMNDRGEVVSVKVPEKMLDAMQNAGPAGAAAGAMFSEEGLKKMMSQSMLRFPAEAVEPGKTWEESSEMPMGMLGSMKLVRTYSYQGADDTGKAEKIGLDSKVQLLPKEDAPIEMALDKQESDGKILFDNAAGHLISSDITQEMMINLKIQGQEIKQKVKSSASLKLAPVASPATPLTP